MHSSDFMLGNKSITLYISFDSFLIVTIYFSLKIFVICVDCREGRSNPHPAVQQSNVCVSGIERAF